MTWTMFSKVWGAAILALIALSIGARLVKAARSGGLGARRFSPRGVLEAAVGLLMAATFVYGWFRYPDAPIRPCGAASGYCGKEGQPRDAETYRGFVRWQTTLFLIWPPGMVVIVLLKRRPRPAA